MPLKQATLAEKYLAWAREEKNRDALLLTEIFQFSDKFEPNRPGHGDFDSSVCLA